MWHPHLAYPMAGFSSPPSCPLITTAVCGSSTSHPHQAVQARSLGIPFVQDSAEKKSRVFTAANHDVPGAGGDLECEDEHKGP
ncbi:unnamed protein product [Urochloa humidicola]